MPYKAADLRKAIDKGDLAEVRRIIEEKDAKGNPTVDINHICTICPACSKIGSPDRWPEHGSCTSCDRGETCQICSTYKKKSGCVKQSAWHYTLYREMDAGKKYEILLALLAVTDSDNDPVINLEAKNGLGESALTAIIGDTASSKKSKTIEQKTFGREGFTVAETRQLVYKIINLRTHGGFLVGHFSEHTGFIGALNQSILLGDVEIVRMILDLRDDDGYFAINVNQVLHWGMLAQTPLDIAYSGSYWFKGGDPHHIVNKQIVDLLEKAGALHYSKLKDISPEEQEKIQLERMKKKQEESEADCEGAPSGCEEKKDCFFGNKQNVHSIQVEQTVDNSIVKLQQYYKKHSLDEKEYHIVLDEIEKFLDTIKTENPNYPHIKKGLEFVKSCHEAVHPISGLTMAQILILVWTGVNDREAVLENHMDYGDIVQFRRNRFLDELQEIATTYRRGAEFAATCIPGARSRLLKTLSYLHPEVFISHTKEEITELFFTRLDILQTKAIDTYTYEEKRQILASWNLLNDLQPGNRESVPAYDFIKQHYSKIKSELEAEFKNSVDQAIIDGALARYPMPIVHKPLHALIQKINTLVTDDKSRPLAKIQKYAENVFDVARDTFEADYQWLNAQYQDYQLLKKLIDKIKARAVDRTDAKQIKSHLSGLKWCFQMLWEALSENDANASDMASNIDQIKKIARQLYKNSNEPSIVLELEKALSTFSNNKKLSKITQNKLPAISEHLSFFKLKPNKNEKPIYKKLADQLAEKINLYDPDINFKENHRLLEEQDQSYEELMKIAKKIEVIEYKGDDFFAKLTIQLKQKISVIDFRHSFFENYQMLDGYYQFYEKLLVLHTRMLALRNQYAVFPLESLEQNMLEYFDVIERDKFLTVLSDQVDYFEEMSSFLQTKKMPTYLIRCIEQNITDYAQSKKEIKLNRGEAKNLAGCLEKIIEIDHAMTTLTDHADHWDEKEEDQAVAIQTVASLALQIRRTISRSVRQNNFQELLTRLTEHITIAKDVLESHRGMKDKLAYFTITVLTAGAALIFLGVRKAWHSYYNTPNVAFFPPLTDTESIKKTASLTAAVNRFRP